MPNVQHWTICYNEVCHCNVNSSSHILTSTQNLYIISFKSLQQYSPVTATLTALSSSSAFFRQLSVIAF